MSVVKFSMKLLIVLNKTFIFNIYVLRPAIMLLLQFSSKFRGIKVKAVFIVLIVQI